MLAMQLAPNAVIAGRFRLNRPLGRGAMGSVWHATHLGLDIPCAVKFIEGGNAQVPEAIARFEREAKSAAQLRSPNVVQILDHGVSEGTPYIAMELLDGEDLGKRLAREGRLPPRLVVGIIRDVCRALTKAHAANIIHRDLKPDNIFLVRDDDRDIAKVLDFGIAKAKTGQGATTRAGEILGTPYYMSPEQIQGGQELDARSDLWSLAVIAFRCLTGKLPFESKTLAELLMKIIMEPLPVPSEIAPDLPRRFDLWWARASERDKEKRFQTAKDLDIALALAFGLSPAAGKKVGATMEMPMTGDAAAQHRAIVAAHPAPAPRAPSPFTPNAVAVTHAPPVAHAPHARPARSRAWIVIVLALSVVALVVTIVVVVASRGSGTAPSPSAPIVAESATPATSHAPGASSSPSAPPTNDTAPSASAAEPAKSAAPETSAKHDAGRTTLPPRPRKSNDLGF